MIGRWIHRIMIAVCAVLALQTATAQDTRSMPPVVLRIDTANLVRYRMGLLAMRSKTTPVKAELDLS